MKLLLTLLALLSLATLHAQPAPRSLRPAAGTFRFGAETTLAADATLRPLADYAAAYLGCPVRQSATGGSAVVLTLDPAAETSPEGYRLDITPAYVRIGAATPGGVFNGLQQLFRLLPPEVYAGQGIPAGTTLDCLAIDDAPRYAYRGMMLDVARTWIDGEALKRYIDLFAFHGINKLHLHLADDEGWRIEILSHPELTRIGGFRGGDSPVRPVYGKWNEKYGGYYTQREMRAIIDYAALRNIEIIPEIDLPGHSRNIASVRPEIRCGYAPDTLSTRGYDYRSAWCVAREENYALLDDILGELCELFPSEHIHIGGDEVETEQWMRCPDCRALMRRMGTDDPRRLQDRFMERVTDILRRHGKCPAVWEEAAQTGAYTRASRVHGWHLKACREVTAKGYRTVAMPGEYCYFDMRQSSEEDGHVWAAIFDARKVFSLDLAKMGFTPEQLALVEGIEGAFFSELYVSHEPEKPDYLDYMLFPRVCALARIAWSGNDEGWERYYEELRTRHYDRMTAMGIRFRLFPPKLNYREGVLSAATDDGAELFYAVDGGQAQPYRGAIRTKEPHRFLIHSRHGTGRSPEVATPSRYRTIEPAVGITSSMGEHPRFPFAKAASYRSTARTTRTCGPGDWILYTFEEPVRCREMFIQTGHRHLPKTIFTTGYVEVSYDGSHFERAGDLEAGAVTLRPDRAVKAVRVVSTCNDNGTPFVTILPPIIRPVL